MTDESEKYVEKTKEQAIQVISMKSNDGTFASTGIAITKRGALLKTDVEEEYKKHIANGSTSVRRFDMSHGIYGYAGLGIAGPGGSEELLVATWPERNIDLQIKITIPRDGLAEDGSTNAYHTLVMGDAPALSAKLIEAMGLLANYAANVDLGSKLPTPEVLLPQVTMTAVEYKVDLLALNRERENPPFEFRGGAGTGRVIDRQGNVLLESSDEIAIFGAAVGPDKEKVLVKGGDATNLVLEVSSGRKIKLTLLPPGTNMLGFGDWHWIGPNLLFGISGVERIFHEGPHENCCSENNVAQTKFYTFDLLTEQLSEVVMPNTVTHPLVNAAHVTSDGHIHLQLSDLPDDVEPDLGWFKIDASK